MSVCELHIFFHSSIIQCFIWHKLKHQSSNFILRCIRAVIQWIQDSDLFCNDHSLGVYSELSGQLILSQFGSQADIVGKDIYCMLNSFVNYSYFQVDVELICDFMKEHLAFYAPFSFLFKIVALYCTFYLGLMNCRLYKTKKGTRRVQCASVLHCSSSST